MVGAVVGAVVKVGVALVVAMVLGAGALVAAGSIFDLSVFGTKSESRDEQVVRSIERHEQVVLLGLGIQGIKEQKESQTVFGVGVPGSARTTFLQYGFQAKLGIDGEQVSIKKTGPDAYRVSIPEFIFIGHDDPTFKVAVEDNGSISFITPEIDEAEMITEILNDETQQTHLDDNEEMLREQAENFYRGIITSVDPAIEVEFDFAG